MKKLNIYRSCKELPLDRFIEMWSNAGILSYLVKGYDPEREDMNTGANQDELRIIWEDIKLEYTSLMDKGNLARMIKASVSIELLSMKLETIIGCVRILNIIHEATCVQILRDLGFDFPFDKANPEQYNADLKRVLSLSKPMEVDLIMMKADFDSMKVKDSGEPNKEGDEWQDALIILSDEAGQRLDPKQMTVYEFARRHSNYIQKIKLRIAQAKKGHGST